MRTTRVARAAVTFSPPSCHTAGWWWPYPPLARFLCRLSIWSARTHCHTIHYSCEDKFHCSYYVSWGQTYMGVLKDNRLAHAPTSSQHLLLTVDLLMRVQFPWAVNYNFNTIVTNYNGPLAADIARIDVATHVKGTKFGASSTLMWLSWDHIRDYIIVVRSVVRMSRVYFLLYYRYQL